MLERLGRLDPTRQGTGFVEDTTVRAVRLRDSVPGFRAVVDRAALQYSIFGHADDVGCVHDAVTCQIKLMSRLKGLLKPGEIATPDAEGTLTALGDLSLRESLGAQNSPVMRRNFEPAIE